MRLRRAGATPDFELISQAKMMMDQKYSIPSRPMMTDEQYSNIVAR